MQTKEGQHKGHPSQNSKEQKNNFKKPKEKASTCLLKLHAKTKGQIQVYKRKQIES